MKSWDKDVEQSFLKDEKAVIRNLEKCYQSALKEIDTKIGNFATRISAGDNVQSAIYQMRYQQELKKQIEESIKNLQSNNYSTITDYLQSTYKNSFVGAQYVLHKQNIPLIIPINQHSMMRALTLNSKINIGLYNRLGVDVEQFKHIITTEVSRGIATGSSWNQIAKQISNKGNVAYSNASRIARTEGHRIQSEAKIDAYTSAKAKGADIVKQWDSTLDGKTRDTHRKLDGQIRELDEDFEVDGMTVSAPGHFGDPAEDCNCRCCLLQRARWALDEAELKTLQDRAEYFGLDKAKDFSDFKEKYLNAVENSDDNDIIEIENTPLQINLQLFAKIPEEKFTKYALDPIRQPDKARAFRDALGYTIDNYQELIENIQTHFDESLMVLKAEDKFGKRYELVMNLTGANGKTAKVCTAWIKENENAEPRLTSAYVTKKKVTGFEN